MILKQERKIIRSVMKKKNLFVLDIPFLPRTILVKERGRLMYLLNKNLQIKLWYRQVRYVLNAKFVETSKITDGIKIIIDKEKLKEHFFLDIKSKAPKSQQAPIITIIFQYLLPPHSTNSSTQVRLLINCTILILRVSTQILSDIRK